MTAADYDRTMSLLVADLELLGAELAALDVDLDPGATFGWDPGSAWEQLAAARDGDDTLLPAITADNLALYFYVVERGYHAARRVP